MKRLFLIAVVLASCASGADDRPSHCYLYTALYLISGNIDWASQELARVRHDWPDAGRVSEAFYAYDEDNMEFHCSQGIAEEKVYAYQNIGCRTATTWGDHSEPLFYGEPIPEYTAIYVACD